MSHEPDRKGAPWKQTEVDLVYLTPDDRETNERLASHLRRTADAVDFARRWSDPDAGFPPEAENRIFRLMPVAEERYGKTAHGKYSFEEALRIVSRRNLSDEDP